MSEKFFIYHFNGGNGLSGAFSEVGESGEAGVSTEYGYLVNDAEIQALADHLVDVVELEGGVSPVRDVDGEIYQTLRQSPEEVISEVREELDFGRVEDYDVMNILRTPVEGYAKGDDIARGVNGEKDLRKSARKGYVEGHRESFRNRRAKDNTTNHVEFYTNSFGDEELNELEQMIKNL